MPDLVVLGTGGHARSCLDVLATTEYRVSGCVGDPPTGKLQAEYLGGDAELRRLRQSGLRWAFVAVGDNRVRARITSEVIDAGFDLASVVSRHAVVSPTAVIGAGSVIMHGAVVGAYTSIGRGCIINTGAVVDHDGAVGDFAHLAPGTCCAGNVTVLPGAFLGVGVSVRPATTVGEWAVVGAGAAVVCDVPAGRTFVGVPARQPGESR